MIKGYIKTFGDKAITIQTTGGNQYYGLYENIKDKEIIDYLQEELPFIPVSFLPDFKRWSGKTNYGKRFYALEIELDLIF